MTQFLRVNKLLINPRYIRMIVHGADEIVIEMVPNRWEIGGSSLFFTGGTTKTDLNIVVSRVKQPEAFNSVEQWIRGSDKDKPVTLK